MKICRGCRERLPMREFHRNKKHHDGRETKCKNCRARIARQHREQYGSYLVAQTRKYQQENREYFREYNREYRKRKREAASS